MRTGITCAFVVLALLVSASNAQEDQPFHTSYFADETTISLSVTVAATSLDPEYNFDVQVALTERGPEGQIRFIDHARVGATESRLAPLSPRAHRWARGFSLSASL